MMVDSVEKPVSLQVGHCYYYLLFGFHAGILCVFKLSKNFHSFL